MYVVRSGREVSKACSSVLTSGSTVAGEVSGRSSGGGAVVPQRLVATYSRSAEA